MAALESCANYMHLRRIPIFGGRDYCAYLPANSEIVMDRLDLDTLRSFFGRLIIVLVHRITTLRARSDYLN